MSITIDNSQDSAVKSGNWSNPGASLFDAIMEEDNYEALLNEAYLLHGDVSKKDKTSYSASGCKYPHHVIRGDKLVVSEAGVKAAYQRAKQMGIFKGNVKSHLEKHYKELGIYKDSTMNESMETIDKNFQFIESFLGINENELINGMIEQPSVSAFNESVDSPLYQEFIGVETPEALLAWMDDHIDYDHDIEMWRLKDPETTIEVGKGNCHDQSLLEKAWFDHHNISNKQIFFIEYNEGEEVGGSTHTFSTFIGTDGEFYWFEHAWENYRGIHGPFKTRDQLVNYVHECWKKDDDINQGKYQDIAFFYIPNYEIGMTLGTYVESWYIDKAINESLSWIDSIVHNDKFRDQEFNEKSHSTLKYCYRVGFDAETGDEVAVQFILDPDKLLKVGDNDALLHLSSEEFDKKNSDALAVFKDQIKKLGHIDFSTDEMKIDKIFHRNGKSLSEVKLIPLMNTNLCNQIRSRYKYITNDQTLDQYIQSDEFKNKVKAVYDLYKQAETYRVGDVGGKNQYKMTKLIWNPELLFSYRFTPVLRGFNVPGRSKGLYTPNVRHHSQADIDAYKASDMMNKFKAEYALNEMFTYDCDNESDSSYIVNYPNGSIMYECPAYVNLEKLYLDPIFNPSYEYDKPIAIVESGGEINLDDIMTMNGVNSARIWSAMFENATDHIVSDVKYFMDLGYTTFNESEDETVNDIVRTVFNEKSHGGLKFSFRMGINKENGHLIKVVFDLSKDDVVRFGSHDDTNDIPSEKWPELKKNINKTGHNDFTSLATVKAIIDMDTNEHLQTVKMVGVMNGNQNFVRKTLKEREEIMARGGAFYGGNKFTVGMKEEFNPDGDSWKGTYKTTTPAKSMNDLQKIVNPHLHKESVDSYEIGEYPESLVNDTYTEGFLDAIKSGAKKVVGAVKRFSGFLKAKKSLANLQKMDTPAMLSADIPLTAIGTDIVINTNSPVNENVDQFTERSTLSSGDIKKAVEKLRRKFKCEIVFVQPDSPYMVALGPASAVSLSRDDINRIAKGIVSDNPLENPRMKSNLVGDAGEFNQVILVSPSMLAEYNFKSAEDVEILLSHEYGHIKTFDQITDKIWIDYAIKKNIIGGLGQAYGTYKHFDEKAVKVECNLYYYKLIPEKLANEAGEVTTDQMFDIMFGIRPKGLLTNIDLDYVVNMTIPDNIFNYNAKSFRGTILSTAETVECIKYTVEIYKKIIKDSEYLKLVINSLNATLKYMGSNEVLESASDEFADFTESGASADPDIEKKWFITSDDGVDNCCIKVTGYEKPMRGRSAMITLKNEGGKWFVLCKRNDDDYGVPGGGWNKNESPERAAIRELAEETQSKVTKVQRMGTLIEYHETVKKWVKDHVPNEEDWWYGYYSAIFVGIYDGEFQGNIAEEDRESGYTWKPVDEIHDKFPKEYSDAIDLYISNEFHESTDTFDDVLTESGNILDEYIHEADEEDPPAMEDQSEEESSEDKKEDILDEPIEDESSENEKKEEQEDEPPAIEPKSLPKQTDEAEINKNGVNRKKLYIAFIEWCKEYNQKNTFGSNFDKDVFKVTYPFIPNEMRYFYRLANPNICVLSGDLTFFPLADLRKLNADNKQIQELLIFAATPNDIRVFSTKDKKVYLAVEDDGGALKLTKVLGETFDLYLQTMIKKGDILNAPPESNEEEGGNQV